MSIPMRELVGMYKFVAVETVFSRADGNQNMQTRRQARISKAKTGAS
jgi:hypothetical protein